GRPEPADAAADREGDSAAHGRRPRAAGEAPEDRACPASDPHDVLRRNRAARRTPAHDGRAPGADDSVAPARSRDTTRPSRLYGGERRDLNPRPPGPQPLAGRRTERRESVTHSLPKSTVIAGN